MTILRTSIRVTVGGLIALLGLFATTDLSSSDMPPDGEVPHPEEVRLMEELAAWTGETPTSSTERPFPDVVNLAQSVQQYPDSFALFRKVAGPEGKAEILETLPYGELIRRVAEEHSVDPLLIAAVASAESSFDPGAISPVGAQGLMQLMPATAAWLGALPEEELRGGDPRRNLELGARYLKRLMRLYGGDVPLVLAAYNSGPGNVRKFGGIPPFSETREYVERVLARYIDLQNSAFQAETYRVAEMGQDLAAGS